MSAVPTARSLSASDQRDGGVEMPHDALTRAGHVLARAGHVVPRSEIIVRPRRASRPMHPFAFAIVLSVVAAVSAGGALALFSEDPTVAAVPQRREPAMVPSRVPAGATLVTHPIS